MKINLHWPHGIPVYLITLALALAIPAAADSGTWSGEVTLTGPNVYVEEGAYIVPADTGFEVEFDGKYEPSDPDLKVELEDEDDPRASYRYQWTFAPDGQAVGPDDQRQATGKFTQASSEANDKTVSVEVEVVGEGVTGEIKETFEKNLTAIGLASLTAAEDGSDPENSAVTTDPGDTQTLYIIYTEDAEENSTTVINLDAARSPDGDFPDSLPEWTLTAPDGADELPYEPGTAFDYTAQVPGVYLFTAECGNELKMKVVVINVEIIQAGDSIVPYSQRNTIRYSWGDIDIKPDSVTLEVYDNEENLVRTIEGLPTSYYSATDYAQYEWNGLDDNEEPLKETDAPYELKIKAEWQDIECADKTSADVKEWQFSFTIHDNEAFEGSGRSGIDPETVTPQLVTTSVEFAGGPVDNIDHYDVTVVDDDGNPVPDEGPNALVKLMSGTGEEDHYLFYTTPSNFDNIFYTVDIEIQEGGALDRARNEWDLDGETAGIQRKLQWQFTIDAEGQFFKVSDGEPGYDEDINE